MWWWRYWNYWCTFFFLQTGRVGCSLLWNPVLCLTGAWSNRGGYSKMPQTHQKIRLSNPQPLMIFLEQMHILCLFWNFNVAPDLHKIQEQGLRLTKPTEHCRKQNKSSPHGTSHQLQRRWFHNVLWKQPAASLKVQLTSWRLSNTIFDLLNSRNIYTFHRPSQ